METSDIQRFRGDTAGTETVIHFNNAGASLMPDVVWQTVEDYLLQEVRYGGYEMQDKFGAALERNYSLVAQLLNCKPTEIAMTDGATTGWDRAFYSLPFNEGDRILTAQVEYASNYIA